MLSVTKRSVLWYVGGNIVARLKTLVMSQCGRPDWRCKVMLDAFDEGTIDKLFVVSNEFVNTMTQIANR